jgi:tetratricopeptide (TPR) repeat protein
MIRGMISKSTLTLLLAMLSLTLVVASCQKAGVTVDADQAKKLAGELRDNKLFSAAIDEYRRLLINGELSNPEKGNISYLIGKIYFEDLKDYEDAAAYFVRAKEYDPNGSYISEASQNLVASLEKIGHLIDAKRELNQAANLDKPSSVPGDVPVAKIGTSTIWRSEIERRIQSLPPEAQKQLMSAEARKNFARQYVGVELMYRAALREGYDRDPEIQARQDMVVKNLLVQKYVENKVMPAVKIDTVDVRNFYVANKSDHYKNQPYDSVKVQVFMDYQNSKMEAAYADYITKLAAAEQVEFLDNNVR